MRETPRSYVALMSTHRLASVDLNLLVALDALLAERSVTRAAARVALTQSAMSRTLSRLRELLGDPFRSGDWNHFRRSRRRLSTRHFFAIGWSASYERTTRASVRPRTSTSTSRTCSSLLAEGGVGSWTTSSSDAGSRAASPCDCRTTSPPRTSWPRRISVSPSPSGWPRLNARHSHSGRANWEFLK